MINNVYCFLGSGAWRNLRSGTSTLNDALKHYPKFRVVHLGVVDPKWFHTHYRNNIRKTPHSFEQYYT